MKGGAHRRRRDRRLSEGVRRSVRKRSGVSHARQRSCCQRESLFLGGRDECTQRPRVEWGGITTTNDTQHAPTKRRLFSSRAHTVTRHRHEQKEEESTGTCGSVTFSAEISLSSNTEQDPSRHHIRRGGKRRTTQRKVSFHKMPSVPFRRLLWLWMQFNVHHIPKQLCFVNQRDGSF